MINGMNFGGGGQMLSQQQHRLDPMNQLAQMLARSGAQAQPTNPMGVLDKVAQMGLSGYMMGDAQRKQDARTKDYQQTMANAMAAGMGTPETPDAPGPTIGGEAGYTAPAKAGDMSALARVLSGNPDTAGMGLQMTMADAANRKAMEREDALYGISRSDKLADMQMQRGWNTEDRAAQQAFQEKMMGAQQAQAERMARLQAGLAAGNQQPHLVPVQQADGTVVYQDARSAIGQAYFDPKASASRPITAADRRQIGSALGVPVSEVDPMAGLPPKVAEAAAKEQAKQTEKELAALRDAVATGRASQADLTRFQQLSQQYETGGILNNVVPKSVLGMFSPAAGEMASIADKITPSMRQPGSGATSDFDARMFQSATVGLGKDPKANANIVQAAQAAQKLQEDLLSFKESYATANGGSLRGADAAWKSYLDANPIFDPNSPNAPKLNTKRVSYQQFFSGGGRPAATAPVSASGGWSATEVK